MSVAIAGAGFSGAVVARELAEAGVKVDVYDGRSHVAGNCYTEQDAATGVTVHKYGPHIFHTNDDIVWNYVNRFGHFRPFTHRVKTTVGDRVYSLPINLHTINQFFGKSFGPDEARAFINDLVVQTGEPHTFEEQALAFVGGAMYEAFFKGYTGKQWGCDPSNLPASILKRLPLRFNYDDNYFSHRFQGIPEQGYTSIVEAILDHPLISVHLSQELTAKACDDVDHVFWSGSIDRFFNFELGRLGYRTLDFDVFRHEGDYQGCAVMNYGDSDIPYTRITEHKHFAPWESHAKSVLYRETARECGADDIPYYPVRLVAEKSLLSRYVELAKGVRNVTFIGRLGTYRYIDMDVSIREALDTAKCYLGSKQFGKSMPKFSMDPV